MGTFVGHLLPGVAFSSVAIWWMFAISAQHAINARAHRNRATHPWPGRHLSPEAWLKIGLTTVGIIGEFVTGFKNGRFEHFGNLQHMTMYSFFLLSGVIDLWSARRSGKRILPQGSDVAAILLATLVEWLLFRFHLHGRSPLDVLVHTLLGDTLVAAMLILCVGSMFKDNLLFGYLKAICVLTHGLWFISIGYILHNPWGPPPFDPKDHVSHMIATCIFTWHILVSLLVCGGITIAMQNKYGSAASAVEYSRCPEAEEAALKVSEHDDF